MAMRKAKEAAAAVNEKDPAVSELASAYSTLTATYPSTIGMFVCQPQPLPRPTTLPAVSSEPIPSIEPTRMVTEGDGDDDK